MVNGYKQLEKDMSEFRDSVRELSHSVNWKVRVKGTGMKFIVMNSKYGNRKTVFQGANVK